jgi:hypothetical protein
MARTGGIKMDLKESIEKLSLEQKKLVLALIKEIISHPEESLSEIESRPFDGGQDDA